MEAEVRLYDRLLTSEIDDSQRSVTKINPNSLKILNECKVEPSLKTASIGQSYQFERVGYFCVDDIDSEPSSLVFNRTVQLRDSFKYPSKKS
jgi:glutaminyl-tRNA synthetase